MSDFPIILRGSPGIEGWEPPGREHRGRTLATQVSLYWHAGADASAEVDRFGLMAVLIAQGGLVFHGLLVVPDDLGTRDPAALAGIQQWATGHLLDTVMGPAPWRVLTLREFFDPEATRGATDEKVAKPWAFVPNAYNRGAGPIVGADHGRTLGLVAEHVGPRSGANRGKWKVWLPGWGHDPDGDGWERRLPDRPGVYLESRRVGWSVRFGPCVPGHGTRPAPFLDVLSAAYVLDADRAAGFVEHARNFGVTAGSLPVTVNVDADGAARMAEAVKNVYVLALAVDAESSRWFTTPQDRAEWTTRFPLAYAHSPAGLADHLLRRFRAAPPRRRFPLDPEEDDAWWEAFHGGWCDDLPALRGRGFGAVALDITSAYPLTAHLVGWWTVMTADRLVRRSVLRELRALCARAAKDPTAVLDPAVWARFGLTLCEVVPDGELFPVALDDPARPDGRTETVAVTARGRTMFYGWCDVVAASILSGKVPRIVRAMHLDPEGRQGGLRQRIAVYPGVVLAAGDDPVLGLVRQRREAKAAGDKVLAAELHAVTNSLVSGNFERLDDILRPHGEKWNREEKAGPWTYAPIGVTVTAGARLLLAVMDRQVRDLGSRVAYRDTDSSIIPATTAGGTLTLGDGSSIRELSETEVAGLLAAFDALSPGPGWPVWKRDPKPAEPPMRCVIFGPKRHVEYRGSDDAPELIDWTETGLGGHWSDPAGMLGRCAEGGRSWSKAAVEREVRFAAAKLTDPDRAVRDPAPWDAGSDASFPTLRRLQVTSPELLGTLPASLGAHVGSRFVEAMVNDIVAQKIHSVVAIDPGGALAGWEGLGWMDRASGKRVVVTTDVSAYGTDAVICESLGARAVRFSDRPLGEPVESVTVTPLAVVYRGRVSPVLDASEDGMPGDLARFRVRYVKDHGLGPAQREPFVALARSMPSKEFARLAKITPRVARQIARDELPRRSTVERILRELRRNGAAWTVPSERVCALDGCDHTVAGRYLYCACCPAHAEAGRKRRQRAATSPEPGSSGPDERKETTR